jgi:hypothetical protein
VDCPSAGSGRSTRAGCTQDNALDVAQDGPGVFDCFNTADLTLVLGLTILDSYSSSTTMDIRLAGKVSMSGDSLPSLVSITGEPGRSGESSSAFSITELTCLDQAWDLALCTVWWAGVSLPSALDQHATFFCMQCLHEVRAKPVLLLDLVMHSISFSTHPWQGSSCI